MLERFGNANPDWIRDIVVRERWNDLPSSSLREHLSGCSDCPQSLLQFLRTRGSINYNLHPCFHVAYYSAATRERCLDWHQGVCIP